MLNFDTLPISPTKLAALGKRQESPAEELRLLSLGAAAERYLGSSSGFSFVKLTKTVLQHLSPDQDGFVFDEEISGSRQWNWSSVSEPTMTSNPVFLEVKPSLASSLPLNSLFGTPAVENHEHFDEYCFVGAITHYLYS